MPARSTPRAMRLLAVATVVVASACGGSLASHIDSGPAPMPAGATWTGEWQTNFGPVVLQQKDGKVAGAYKYLLRGQEVVGILTGTMDGNRLAARWQDQQGGAGSGWARFELAGDGQRFDGTWGTSDGGEASGVWSGTRVR